MTYDPYEGVYQYIDEQIGFPHQTSGHRPKQQLPRRDIAAAQRQAAIEAQARQRNLRGSGMTPDALPKVRPRPDADEDLYTRSPRSAVRYQPEEIYRQGNTQVNKFTSAPPANRNHAIPPRRSAQAQQLPPADDQQEQYTNDIDEVAERPRGYRRRVHLHWLVFAGVGLLLMIAGWMALNDLSAWWQNHQILLNY